MTATRVARREQPAAVRRTARGRRARRRARGRRPVCGDACRPGQARGHRATVGNACSIAAATSSGGGRRCRSRVSPASRYSGPRSAASTARRARGSPASSGRSAAGPTRSASVPGAACRTHDRNPARSEGVTGRRGQDRATAEGEHAVEAGQRRGNGLRLGRPEGGLARGREDLADARPGSRLDSVDRSRRRQRRAASPGTPRSSSCRCREPDQHRTRAHDAAR